MNFRQLPGALAISCTFLVVLAPSTSKALTEQSFVRGDLNCSDFGTRERAQKELSASPGDQYGLDSDGDGQACEWNSSTGMWPLAAGGIGLILGRRIGTRKRKGPGSVVPGLKGLVLEWTTDLDGTRTTKLDSFVAVAFFAGWVPWIPVFLLRDHVFPIGTTPAVLLSVCALVGGVLTYGISVTRDNWW